MPVEILIAAHDLNHSLKGYPKNAKNTPCVWGMKERPPDYVILRITDADKSQVEHFLQQWQKTFVYEILNENEQGYRIRVKVDPDLVSASGMNKAFRADIKTHIVNEYNASVFSYDAYEAVIDIPKPADLQRMKLDIHDQFAEVVDHRHFYFDSTDVDNALLQPGGIVEKTRSQVLAMIKNKLDE